VQSAGIAPATFVAPLTKQMLRERNIPADAQFPKGLELVLSQRYDVVVNMSGEALPLTGAHIIDWPVADPIGKSEETYRNVAAQIEALVMRLILDLRQA
jgi:protein-tyrosine-phosphatase